MSALSPNLVINVHRDDNERAFIAQVIESIGSNHYEHFVYGRVKPARKSSYIMVTQGTAREVPDYIADAVYTEANRNVSIIGKSKANTKPSQSAFIVDLINGKIRITPNQTVSTTGSYILIPVDKSIVTHYEWVVSGTTHIIDFHKLNSYISTEPFYNTHEFGAILKLSFSFSDSTITELVAREVNRLQQEYLNLTIGDINLVFNGYHAYLMANDIRITLPLDKSKSDGFTFQTRQGTATIPVSKINELHKNTWQVGVPTYSEHELRAVFSIGFSGLHKEHVSQVHKAISTYQKALLG